MTEGHRLSALPWIAALTGIRPAEVRALQWGDLNRPLCELSIRREVGAGNVVKTTTKTEGSTRTLVVSPALLDRLDWKHWMEDDRLLFQTRNGNPIDPNNLIALFKRWSQEAGLDAAVRPYDLRHTFLTHLFHTTGSMSNKDISRAAGNSTDTLENFYVHEVEGATVDVSGVESLLNLAA